MAELSGIMMRARGAALLTDLENIELTPGPAGEDGLSAYEVAVANGFEGNEAAWLASLVGAPGTPGTPGTNGTNGTNGSPGAPGDPGPAGLSAYEVAVDNGFEGTEEEWLESLVGPAGTGLESPMPYLAAPTAESLRDALIDAGLMLEAPQQEPSVPTNVSVPVISGSLYEGSTLTTTNGTWTDSPSSYSYQWQTDPGTGWENVTGETSNTFEDVPLGEYRVAVVATNGEGDSAPAYSAGVEVVEEPEPGEWAVWDSANANAVLSNGNRTVTNTNSGEMGGALSDKAITVPTYFEGLVHRGTTEAAGFGIQSGWTTHSTSVHIGVAYELPSANAQVTSGWNATLYGNNSLPGATNIQLASLDGSNDQDIIVQFAVDPSTRNVWVKLSTQGTWLGGGDPAAGTNPSIVLGASASPILVAGNTTDPGSYVTILIPEEYAGTAPAGFATGIS